MKDPGEANLNDEALIALVKEGNNSRYFELVYSRYYEKIKAKCFSITKNRNEAEELAEEVMVKIYEKLNTYKGSSKFSTWAYSITYNHCIDYLRVKKNLHYPKWNSDQELLLIPDNVEELNADIDYEKLIELLEELHTEEQLLIKMRYFEDMSFKTIGEVLRITESAAKMRLKRAKTRLVYLYSCKYLKG
jgi:RNA polymerase sigma factor (sigma-70 family)